MFWFLFLNDRFCVVDFVDIVDIVYFVEFVENLWKRVDIYFSYSKYIILWIIGEREILYEKL